MQKVNLGATSLRVLAVLLNARRDGRALSTRKLASLVGISHNGVVCHLNRLRRLGLVDWEADSASSVYACCEFIPAERM